MLLAVGLLALGALVLYAGAEAAVRGAAGLARAIGVPAFVLGALLFGIDIEGLGTAVAASARGDTALAAGEIFGTVLFLFSAAFGAALLVSREPVPSPGRWMVVAPAPGLIAASMVVSDRYVDRLEAGLLLLLYVAYVALVVQEGRLARARAEKLEREAGEVRARRGVLTVMSVGGLLIVAAGAAILVAGAERLVTEARLSSGFVGAAVLGILVSLDEVLLEVLPIRRGTPELATGNLFGTLAAFSSGVLGIAALVRPLEVDSATHLAVIGVAFLYAMVGTVFLARGRAGRALGVVVLAFYAVWLLYASGV
jgi:cation:H+ antiporter